MNLNKIEHLVGLYSCRMDSQLTIISDATWLSGITGYTKEEIENKFHNSLLELVNKQDREKIQASLKKQLFYQDDVEFVFSITRKNGTVIWLLNKGCRVTEEQGAEYLEGVLVEITESKLAYDEQKKVEHELKEQAQRDSLTKLLNAYTTRRTAEEYLESKSYVECAMMIIDLDDFKQVNDQYGHMQGDAILIQTAEAISRLFRAEDIVGRVGGDEFLVLMRDVSDEDLVNNRCAQLIDEMHRVLRQGLKNWEGSCSIGVAFTKGKNSTYSELFESADQALYQAKNQGKKRFVIHNTVAV